MELRFRGRIVVIVCYRFCFYTLTLHQLVSEDLDIEQEGCDIKEDDEYIERVCQVDWDSPPIYDDYLEDFNQEENIELDKNKVIYIRDEPITHIIDETFDIQKQKVIDPFWENFIEQELIEVNKRHE